mmetsp:Transcript_38113/g.99756  ORF Transcript_38113/g.99756 Transcript_38113/m.99756 type:complete len:201 (-) Transcript_38113:35-637(-)
MQHIEFLHPDPGGGVQRSLVGRVHGEHQGSRQSGRVTLYAGGPAGGWRPRILQREHPHDMGSGADLHVRTGDQEIPGRPRGRGDVPGDHGLQLGDPTGEDLRMARGQGVPGGQDGGSQLVEQLDLLLRELYAGFQGVDLLVDQILFSSRLGMHSLPGWIAFAGRALRRSRGRLREKDPSGAGGPIQRRAWCCHRCCEDLC